MSCGILVPDQGWNVYPLLWKLSVLTTGPRGKPQVSFLKTTAKILEGKVKKGKKRGEERKEKRKKTDIKHKFADKQSEFKWTINSKFHGTV